METWTLTYCTWGSRRTLYYGDGTASPGGKTTTLGSGTAILGGGTLNRGGGTPNRGGGTLNRGGGTPFRPVPPEFNHCRTVLLYSYNHSLK